MSHPRQAHGVEVGISVYSGLGDETIHYLDSVAGSFDSIWLPDHLQSNAEGVMEGWTLLSYCLARYPRHLVGHQVLCNEFRNPALLAKMMATAQVLSSGSAVLGIGAGWHAAEAAAYGISFPPTGTRVDRLIEAVGLMRALWRGGRVDFEGDFYRVEGAECLPVPEPMPPVMIGASGERHGLRAVAARADWWNLIFKSLDEYRHKEQVLVEHCRRLGRDPAEIRRVLCTQLVVGETESEVSRLLDRDGIRSVERNGLAGTPQQIVDIFSEAVDAGVDMVIVGFADTPGSDMTELFVEQVVGSIRGW